MNITYREDGVFALILPNRISEKLNLRGTCTVCADPTCNSQLYFSYSPERPHVVKMIDWSVISKIRNIYKKQKAIIEISDYIKEINITKLLANVQQKLRDKNIKYDAIYYIYYFIEETCDLYLFMSLVHYVKDPTVYSPAVHLRFLIVNHNILRPVSHTEIIFLSEAYELDIYPQVKLKNYHRLLQEIIYKIKMTEHKKIHFDDLTIYSLIVYLSDITKDTKTKDKGIALKNSMGYLCGISKRDYAGLILYDKELIIKDSKTFMDIKDIRFNRQTEIKQVFISYPKNGETYSIVDRYGDILIYRLIIRDVVSSREYGKFRLIIMVSEMELIQNIKNIQM
jgi:hypothetical protein